MTDVSQLFFNKKRILYENHVVRNKNYNERKFNNYFEFEIPIIDEFDSKYYAPLVHEEIPDLKPGTIAYDDFWDEQDRRCLYGYAPIVNGVQYPRITGPHYFYLNNVKIKMLKEGERKKELSYPYYRVLDHMIFLEIEKASILGYGLIIGKARRMGLSYIGDIMIIYNLLFFKGNEIGLGAGKEDKAKELYEKVITSLQNLREEYRVSYSKNKTTLKVSFNDRENKINFDNGILSSLTVKTFFSDPSAFEGGSYSLMIFEEIGIQDNLIKSYKATEPCFMEGGIQFGLPLLYGTGGEVDKGSRDMKIVWENNKSYNLKRIFIPAYMYYPGVSLEEDLEEDDPLAELELQANYFNVKTGRTDEKKALEHILLRRKLASKSKDGYIKEVQSRPTEEAHLFLKTDGGFLDRILLNGQLQKIYDSDNISYKPVLGRLDWKPTQEIEHLLIRCQNQKERDRIHIKYNSKVAFVEDSYGTFHRISTPINNEMMPYLADIAGSDSYDEEAPEKGNSNGATLFYRVFNGLTKDYNMPVGLVYERGDATNDDTFYSNSLKGAVYYRTKVLVEYSKTNLINYFIDCGAEHYLKEKPDLLNEVGFKGGIQRYGHQVKGGMKNVITGLLKQEVRMNVHNIFLDLILLDLIDYGDKNTDISMAYGAVLVYKLEMFGQIVESVDEYENEENDLYDFFRYKDTNGEIKVSDYEYDVYNTGMIETFDPRKHLTGEERENYINFTKMQKQKIIEELNNSKKPEYKDPFTDLIKQYLNKDYDVN